MARNVEEYIIRLKDQFSGPMAKAQASTGRMRSSLGKLTGMLGPMAAAGAAAAATMAASRLVRNSINNYNKQAQAIAQVRQGLESTGMVAGRTLGQLEKQAAALQKTSLFGDEDILGGVTAQLLTFTNIAGEQFDKTQQAVLDVTSRLYGADASAESLRSTSIMLGKALNDPVANLGALSRSGIQFSASQKETIKTLAETNRLADAQALILDELTKQYGGSAQAAAEAGMGPLKQFQNRIGDLTERLGEKLLPALLRMVDYLNAMIDFFERNGEAIMKWYKRLMNVVSPLLWIIKLFRELIGSGREIVAFFNGLGAVFQNIGDRLSNFGQRLENVFFASTGQFAKIKKIEKVGESVSEAFNKGVERGNEKYAARRVNLDEKVGAFSRVPSAPVIPITAGAAGTSGGKTTTTVAGSAPKVFNINIEKVNGVETLETTNIRESSTVIGNMVARAIAESLADIQTVAS